MDMPKTGESDESEHLLRRAARGDRDALGALLERHRARLRRMVALRLDQRLRGRIDPSDVIQEAQLEAAGRLDDYLRDPAVPFFLWLRFLVGQRLAIVHRRHLGAEARDAGREVSIDRAALPRATSAALAAQLLGRDTRPSEALARAERKLRLREALEDMDPVDRELLALRHFEQLSNAEAARVLGLRESAASKRYIRALTKLKAILSAMPGGPGELEP
jgi:RNA polymerase sigma-70 factor (ECF subfamily)